MNNIIVGKITNIFLPRPKKKDRCVSGKGSENFKKGRQTYFFSGKTFHF